jgi:hypothetical protein
MAQKAGQTDPWKAVAVLWTVVWCVAVLVVIGGFVTAECTRDTTPTIPPVPGQPSSEWNCAAFGDTFATQILSADEPSEATKFLNYLVYIVGGAAGFGLLALVGFIVMKPPPG